MRVLFITRKYPPSVGGMQLFARDLYESLAPSIQIDLVKWGGSNKWLTLVLPLLFFKSFFILVFKRPHIIHAQDGLLAPLGYVLSKIFRRPYVVVIHGLDITHKNAIYQKLIVPFTAKADQVICISAAAKQECIKRGVSENKTSVITLAVRDEIYPKLNAAELPPEIDIQSDSPVLLTVGRLVKRKGVAWFINNVLPDLVKKFPDIAYVVAGDGQEMTVIKKAVQAEGLHNNVLLVGRTSDKTLAALYARSDIFVMPNIQVEGDIEGFGLVSLEAALCELPVIASRTEGITDAIKNNKNGILIEPSNKNNFVNQIVQLVENPEMARDFGKKARLYTLEHYQWEHIAKQYTQLYLHLTEQNT